MNSRRILATALMIGGFAASAMAIPIQTTNPSETTEIGTRIRWGRTGFEASIFDSNPFGQTPTLNPSGTPVWSVGSAYSFLVEYDYLTGTLELNVDFNRDNSFGTGETISRSAFNGTSSYAGQGFNYLSISGNEGGSTARSTINHLTINGTSFASLSPAGTYAEWFFKDNGGGAMGPITIAGDLTFTTAGTSDERPSWNFNFKVPGTVSVPDGGLTLALLGGAVAGLAALRRKIA